MNNTVLRLRLLICNPKGLGPKKIPGRTSADTIKTSHDRYDARLCSYECRSLKQWEEKAREFAKGANPNQFFVHAMFVDDRTGTRVDLEQGALFVALPKEEITPSAPTPPETSAGTEADAAGGKPCGEEEAPGETVPTAEAPEPADACDGIGSPSPAEQETPPVETPAEPAQSPEPEPAPAPAPKAKPAKGKKR